MFEKGQKVYKLSHYYHATVEQWTFIRKETERNGGGWILYDEDDRYRTMHDINDFVASREECEIHLYRMELQRLQEDKRDYEKSIEQHYNEIEYDKGEINRIGKQLSALHQKYEHLIEKYPEEFI